MSAQSLTNRRHELRLGLCCQFVETPIKFRQTTATSMLRLDAEARREKLAILCLANAEALLAALHFCAANRIGSFRIPSSILPAKTHPTVGYDIRELPESTAIVSAFQRCGRLAAQHGIRTVFHPDQYVVLNSQRPAVVSNAVAELEYHAQVADWVGADVINIHVGGAYGDKTAAVQRFGKNLEQLSAAARSRLSIENDDTLFTPSDLLSLCRSTGLPLVYDVHHHRCLPDELSVEAATSQALDTWDREPLFHVSSPLGGWAESMPRRHHDYIDVADFPDCWRNLAITVEVEAKAKELAVFRLRDELCADESRTGRRREMVGTPHAMSRHDD